MLRNFIEGTKTVVGQDEARKAGNSGDICESNDTSKHTCSSSHQKERKHSISMIDLKNSIDDIACLRPGLEEEINGLCQAKSVEEIWFQKGKMRRETIEENHLKEKFMNESAPFLHLTNQKELQGRLNKSFIQKCLQFHLIELGNYVSNLISI